MSTVITSSGSGFCGCLKVFGSFYDTTTQTVTIGNVKAIEFNTTDISNGVSVVNNILSRPTRLTVNTTGVYDIQFSAQLNRTSGGSPQDTHIWLRKNEIDVPWSDTGITMQSNNGKIVAAWNFFISLNAGQYAELMWTQNDYIELLATSAGPNYSETPSVIVTINKVD
jgi:hypothetical protein